VPPLDLFTGPGLEMMTHPLVAARRAGRFAALGLPVADLTCGIGGDLSALAKLCADVVGIESDPATAIVAHRNVPRALVARGDATVPPLCLQGMAILLDPARRTTAAGRRFDPGAFTPPWDDCMALASGARFGAVKGPPGLPWASVLGAAEIEYVQVGRAMRESAVYLGGDARPGLRRAVVLPTGTTLESDAPECEPGPVPIGAVIHDPASAVTLAGLVRHLGHQVGARLIDPHLGYLTSSSASFTPLADAFEVTEVVPFSVARLRGRLKQLGLAAHEIRRRAFPIEPDELRRLLGPQSGSPATLLCCSIGGRRLVIVARPLTGLNA